MCEYKSEIIHKHILFKKAEYSADYLIECMFYLTSVRPKWLALFVNLDILELYYRFQTLYNDFSIRYELESVATL